MRLVVRRAQQTTLVDVSVDCANLPHRHRPAHDVSVRESGQKRCRRLARAEEAADVDERGDEDDDDAEGEKR